MYRTVFIRQILVVKNKKMHTKNSQTNVIDNDMQNEQNTFKMTPEWRHGYK